MKPALFTVTTLILAVSACGSQGGAPRNPQVSGQCMALLFDVGEHAAYSFSLHGADPSLVGIDVASESEASFELRVDQNSQVTATVLARNCDLQDPDEFRLSAEAAHIVLGLRWGWDAESASGVWISNDYCVPETVTVTAGTYPANKCVATVTSPADAEVSQIVSYFIERWDGPRPFSGLLKEVISYKDGRSDSVVELTSWNGR